MRRSRSEGDRRRTYLSIAHEALEPSPVRNARRVVFVCTQNSPRSQLAAAVWHRHRRPLVATSAGTHAASAAARRGGLSLHARAPQHLDDVREPGDLIIAVCDNAHEELPTDLPRIHWSIPDPTRTPEPHVFDHTIDVLTQRIDRLVSMVGPPSNGADQ